MPTAPPRHNAAKVEENRLKNQREYNRKKRTGQGFYNSTPWRKTRANHIRQNPVCVDCKAEGKTTAANVVDHIIPIKKGGALVAPDNLQSLCNTHHNQKTARDLLPELNDGGEASQIKIGATQSEQVILVG